MEICRAAASQKQRAGDWRKQKSTLAAQAASVLF
jgi:hypothetical protein